MSGQKIFRLVIIVALLIVVSAIVIAIWLQYLTSDQSYANQHAEMLVRALRRHDSSETTTSEFLGKSLAMPKFQYLCVIAPYASIDQNMAKALSVHDQMGAELSEEELLTFVGVNNLNDPPIVSRAYVSRLNVDVRIKSTKDHGGFWCGCQNETIHYRLNQDKLGIDLVQMMNLAKPTSCN